MKRFIAIMLALVMAFSVVSLVACKTKPVSLKLHVADGQDITCEHVYGQDDLPVVTNGTLTFDGWYYDKDYTKPFSVSDTGIEDGTSLYAKWTASTPTPTPSNKVTITLNPNYTGASVQTFEIDIYSTFALPNWSRTDYTFDGWFSEPVGGIQYTDTWLFIMDTTLYAHWTSLNPETPDHTHDFGDGYFIYVQCSVEGCDVWGRKQGTDSFKEDFVYDFTQEDRDEMDAMYNGLVSKINGGSVDIDTIIASVEEFEDLLDYVQYQYQAATVMYSMYYNEEWQENSKLIGSAYNDWWQDYYTLFGLIAKSTYNDDFYADWEEDEIEYVLEMAAIYSDSEDNLQTKADEISYEYSDLLYTMTDDSQLGELYEIYGRYVQANNAIAAQFGDKYDNFMDYSYANDYGREYTPQDVAQMREYVRANIAPILIKLVEMFQYAGFDKIDANYNFFDSLVFTSVFELDKGYEQSTYNATKYIGEYFQFLNNNQTGDKEINFYGAVNELFKNGNYFTSNNGDEGAYTYYIRAKETPIMFFDTSYDSQYGYTYSNAFTFVHEFGHYYADLYVNGRNFSMDHAETHSQGNEMLFLAWLNDHVPSNAGYGYSMLQLNQLFGIINTIVQATIVDEFEQAVYTNTYGDGEFKDGIQPSQYGDLYTEILNSYGEGMADILGDYYWLYVVVDHAAYYISYAMSALPSLEIYVTAMSDGLEVARDCYFKLFTVCDNYDYSETVDYTVALAGAGLDSPFGEAMYTKIAKYFETFSI